MKCKICGHNTRTIGAMSEHYRKKHPAAMKRRARRRDPDAEKGILAQIKKIKQRLDDLEGS